MPDESTLGGWLLFSRACYVAFEGTKMQHSADFSSVAGLSPCSSPLRDCCASTVRLAAAGWLRVDRAVG